MFSGVSLLLATEEICMETGSLCQKSSSTPALSSSLIVTFLCDITTGWYGNYYDVLKVVESSDKNNFAAFPDFGNFQVVYPMHG